MLFPPAREDGLALCRQTQEMIKRTAKAVRRCILCIMKVMNWRARQRHAQYAMHSGTLPATWRFQHPDRLIDVRNYPLAPCARAKWDEPHRSRYESRDMALIAWGEAACKPFPFASDAGELRSGNRGPGTASSVLTTPTLPCAFRNKVKEASSYNNASMAFTASSVLLGLGAALVTNFPSLSIRMKVG